MRFTRIVVAMAMASGAGMANAMTDADIEAVFARYEARIAELEARVAAAERAAAPDVPVEDLGERLVAIERDARRQQRRTEGLEQRVDRAAEKVKVQGFGSAGVAILDEDDISYAASDGEGIDDTLSYIDSIAGVQFDFQVNEQLSFTTQLVARTQADDFNFGADWAYLSWKATESLTIRGGRMRMPLYMLSDYLEVGYVYPWARPPQEAYNLAQLNIDRYEGFDLLYNYDAGAFTGTIQALVGRANPVTGSTTLDVEDMWGLIGTASFGDLTLRAGYLQAELGVSFEADSSFDILDGVLSSFGLGRLSGQDDASFASIGFQYDNGSLLASGEFVRLTLDGLLASTDGWYLSGGYRFGRFTPYAYYAGYESADDEDRLAVRDGLDQAAADLEAQAAALAPTQAELESLITMLEAGTAPLFDPSTGLLLSSALNPLLPDPSNAQLVDVFNLEGARANLDAVNDGLAQLAGGAADLRAAGAGLLGENGKQSTLALGLRFEPASNVALKVQWDYVHDIDGQGLANGNPGENFNVFSLVIDTVF